MKSIGEQVREFRELNKLGYSAMARAVQKHSQGMVVSRQKIKQLEEKPDRMPRYITALAKAMGTTVEILEKGQWEPPPLKHGSSSEPMAHELSDQSATIPLVKWEDLMTQQLPEQFRVELMDDVFEPHMRAGDQLIFERSEKEKAGDIVLLTDGNGAFYPRKLKERLKGELIAVAPNSAYEPLDIKDLELKVVGVCVRVITRPYF